MKCKVAGYAVILLASVLSTSVARAETNNPDDADDTSPDAILQSILASDVGTPQGVAAYKDSLKNKSRLDIAAEMTKETGKALLACVGGAVPVVVSAALDTFPISSWVSYFFADSMDNYRYRGYDTMREAPFHSTFLGGAITAASEATSNGLQALSSNTTGQLTDFSSTVGSYAPTELRANKYLGNESMCGQAGKKSDIAEAVLEQRNKMVPAIAVSGTSAKPVYQQQGQVSGFQQKSLLPSSADADGSNR
jgi:hypothetical protein